VTDDVCVGCLDDDILLLEIFSLLGDAIFFDGILVGDFGILLRVWEVALSIMV
jgi:hypothetical protein